jgi:hypothetical protein
VIWHADSNPALQKDAKGLEPGIARPATQGATLG